MRNFITNFRKVLGIHKQFAGNRVNEKGSEPKELDRSFLGLQTFQEENRNCLFPTERPPYDDSKLCEENFGHLHKNGG